MDVKLVSKNKDNTKATFEVKGLSNAYINTIRRVLSDEVPTMAIDKVEVIKNSSVLYDEIVAHRLGLVVLKTDLKSYQLPDEDNPEESALNSVKLTLEAKGPGVVYASQMKSKDPKVVPVFPKTPIVKLLKDQELKVAATATMGLGRIHAKWSPGMAYYKINSEGQKDPNKNDVTFTVESWGQLSVKEMMTQAFKAFDDKLSEFESELKNI